MIAQFIDVWSTLVTFIVSLFSEISSIFVTTSEAGAVTGLTFVGTMAVVMAGVAIMLLVFNLVRSFFGMRG